MADISQYTIEDAEILFRNFEGRGTQYNREGERNFNVILPAADKAELEADGWAIGELCDRENPEDCRPKMKVGVRFDVMPPNIVLITNGGQTRTRLTEETIGVLDSIEIKTVDMIVRPYDWTYGDKTGTKAMLKSMYVTALEDELDRKYGMGPVAGDNVPHEEDMA